MVRKTKEDANITRQRIINAAREVFLAKGVSRTSLEQIAKHAGVTRGAVYWHFENKSALFHAIREQIFLPLFDRMDDTLLSASNKSNIDALARIETFMLATIDDLTNNTATKETYIILMSKCEYVDEFNHVMQEILTNCDDIVQKMEMSYQKALEEKLVDTAFTAAELAMDTHLFFGGLLHMWVKDEDGTRLRNNAKLLIKTHIKLKRAL